jgi:hypothetical protein
MLLSFFALCALISLRLNCGDDRIKWKMIGGKFLILSTPALPSKQFD